MKRVITYGTFDLLHYGHINLLKRAKEYGDYLIVALSTDEFNWDEKRKKCYFTYEQRKKLLEAVRYVDLVIPEKNWEQKILDVKKYHVDTFVISSVEGVITESTNNTEQFKDYYIKDMTSFFSISNCIADSVKKYWGIQSEVIPLGTIPIGKKVDEKNKLKNIIWVGNPSDANKKCKRFFDRTMLLYGEATKKLLMEKSVFTEEQIEVIGNPRILKYKQEFGENNEKRQYILFTSQPFEQDVKGATYYSEMIPFLQSIQKQLETDDKWRKYQLVIKLHPRENNGIKNRYKESIPECEVFDNTTPLYELLGKSFLHLTANSTTLYEAALFDTPTVLLPYQGYKPEEIFGFDVKITNDILPNELVDTEKYREYLFYLKDQTLKYM